MKKLLIYLKAYRKEACLAPIFKMLEAVFELFVAAFTACRNRSCNGHHSTVVFCKSSGRICS